ncbi:MAG: J domain-containing protein [Niabella sp.]
MKDYYQILQVSTSASATELKTAFRRLAHLYHPDKSGNNKYAVAHFNLIREAYETLSTPALREKYMQERRFAKAADLVSSHPMNTPEELLWECIALHKRTNMLDAYRMDKHGLASEVNALLSPAHLDMLQRFADKEVNTEIVRLQIDIARVLRPADELKILATLQGIVSTDSLQLKLSQRSKHARQEVFWNRYKIIFVLLAVTAFCLLIAFLS